MPSMEEKFIAHMASDQKDFEYLKEAINRIEESQKKAETNHWVHVQASTTALEKSYKELNEAIQGLITTSTSQASDMAWLKKFFWLVATGSVGSLVAAVLQLVLRKS